VLGVGAGEVDEPGGVEEEEGAGVSLLAGVVPAVAVQLQW
jgi:hypothetical protein